MEWLRVTTRVTLVMKGYSAPSQDPFIQRFRVVDSGFGGIVP